MGSDQDVCLYEENYAARADCHLLSLISARGKTGKTVDQLVEEYNKRHEVADAAADEKHKAASTGIIGGPVAELHVKVRETKTGDGSTGGDEDWLSVERKAGPLGFKHGYLRLTHDTLMRRVFMPTVTQIVEHLRGILKAMHKKQQVCDYVFLVGGFAESEVVRLEVEKMFAELKQAEKIKGITD